MVSAFLCSLARTIFWRWLSWPFISLSSQQCFHILNWGLSPTLNLDISINYLFLKIVKRLCSFFLQHLKPYLTSKVRDYYSTLLERTIWIVKMDSRKPSLIFTWVMCTIKTKEQEKKVYFSHIWKKIISYLFCLSVKV